MIIFPRFSCPFTFNIFSSRVRQVHLNWLADLRKKNRKKLMWKINVKNNVEKSKCRKIMKCVVYLSGFFGRVLYILWGAIAKHQLIANAVRSSREKLVVDPVPIYTFRGSGIFVIRSSKYQYSLSVLRDYFLVLFFSFIFFSFLRFSHRIIGCSCIFCLR